MFWKYENKERIESHVSYLIDEFLKDEIYKAYLRNETYVYNVDAHVQMLYHCANSLNADMKKEQESELRSNNYRYTNSDREKEKFVVCEDLYSDEEMLGYEDDDHIRIRYKGTTYKRMRYNITEFIKDYQEECETIYQQRIESYSRDFKPSNQIEILEMKKYMRESGNGTSNNSMSNNRSQTSVNKFSSIEDLFLDYMRQNGFECNTDNNGRIHFNCDNRHFVCYVEEYEDGFSQLVVILPDIFAIGSNEVQDWKIINELNQNLDVKFVIDSNKSINVIVSTWVDSTPEMDYLIPALITNLLNAQDEFNKRM